MAFISLFSNVTHSSAAVHKLSAKVEFGCLFGLSSSGINSSCNDGTNNSKNSYNVNFNSDSLWLAAVEAASMQAITAAVLTARQQL